MNRKDRLEYTIYGALLGMFLMGVIWLVDDYYQFVERNEVIAEQYKQDDIVQRCHDHIESMFFKIRSDPDYDFPLDNESWIAYDKLGCNKKLEFGKVDLLLMKEKLKSEGVIP